MINRYYATDCKVKPNSNKDIRVIREDDFNLAKSKISTVLEDVDNSTYDSVMELLEIKDCFGNEQK